MAQTKQAKEKDQNDLESHRQTQTPPSRQAGSNQPQGMSRGDRRENSLSRRDQFSTLRPFSLLDSFRTEMDRLFDDFGFGRALSLPTFGGAAGSAFDWTPQTEVFKRGNQLVVRADLPGLTKEDVEVDVEGSQIKIRGERRSEHDEKGEGFYRSERSYGSFFRSVPLPEGTDADQARAEFNNGVLEITMPLPESTSKAKRLEIAESSPTKSKGTSAG